MLNVDGYFTKKFDDGKDKNIINNYRTRYVKRHKIIGTQTQITLKELSYSKLYEYQGMNVFFFFQIVQET